MEQLINRLIRIGYSPEEAESLYDFYSLKNSLGELEEYVAVKEFMKETL